MDTKNANSEELLRQLLEKVYEKYKELLHNNEVNYKIYAKLQDFNHDPRFLRTALKHFRAITKILWRRGEARLSYEKVFLSKEECLQFYVGIFFLNNLKKYSNSTLPFTSNFVERVESIPIEYFLKPSKEIVVNVLKNLIKDILLFVEVVETKFCIKDTELYVSRLISRVGDDSIIYNLNIKVYLFKKEEMLRLKREFQLSEVLKVAMLGHHLIDNQWNFFATTNFSQLKKSDDLDVLLKKEFPFNLCFLKEASKYTCYAHYLKSQEYFDDMHNLNRGIKSLGLDPFHIYSYNEEEEELVCPKWFYVGALKNNAAMVLKQYSDKYLKEAIRFVENGDILNALSSFDEALKFWPENYKVFEARGKMYADRHKKQFCDLIKAQYDFCEALKLNPSAENLKQELSDIYLSLAKNLKNKKKYEESRKVLQASLKLNTDNQKANLLLQTINKKMQSSIATSSDTELIALQKERKKLLLELDKEKKFL